MMVGELVLPDVMVGITEASTTRNRSMPNTRKRSSTTAIGSLGSPIFAVPTGWKIVVPMSPADFANVASSLSRTCSPGRYSTGWNALSAGCETMCRVTRIESAATRLSSSVAR
jgi:hypothetical protein